MFSRRDALPLSFGFWNLRDFSLPHRFSDHNMCLEILDVEISDLFLSCGKFFWTQPLESLIPGFRTDSPGCEVETSPYACSIAACGAFDIEVKVP
jgi:hypothetical protein